MSRLVLVSLCTSLLAGCVADDVPATEVDSSALSLAFARQHVTADIYHYEWILPVGDAPNAALRVHRVVREVAPYVPRHTSGGAMLLHGDFSTFVTNFVPVLGSPPSPVPGLAPYLAAQGLDVWGVDRRWTLPASEDADISDFAAMGIEQEIGDIRAALGFARTLRVVGGHGFDKLALVGFSHGGQLAYAYAAVEASEPPGLRHVDALVPIDYYGDFGPDEEDMRLLTCEFSAYEYELVANGVVDSPNGLQQLAVLARTAPDDPSPLPFAAGLTNRGAMLAFAAQTYFFAPFAPFYHLNAPILDGDVAIGLSETPEAAVMAWFEGATWHQAMLETADLDALLCGEDPLPVDARLSKIEVPLFYLGAAGGIGSLGLHATTSVSSTDVTALVVQRFTPERRAEDFGHADLLYANDAEALAWQPLATWLLHH